MYFSWNFESFFVFFCVSFYFFVIFLHSFFCDIFFAIKLQMEERAKKYKNIVEYNLLQYRVYIPFYISDGLQKQATVHKWELRWKSKIIILWVNTFFPDTADVWSLRASFNFYFFYFFLYTTACERFRFDYCLLVWNENNNNK